MSDKETKQFKPTEAEEQRCAVGYGDKKTMPAVSKEFVMQAKAYSELHKYCRDNYGDEFVAYTHQASGIMLKKNNVDLPFEVGSRAVCCKALPTGTTRIQFFKKIEEVNNQARKIHLQEAAFLEERLLRIRDSFSLCTTDGGCYRVTDLQARTLLRGMQMLEIVTSNHIAHINACLSSEVFDPLSGCMNLPALQAYLSRNRDVIVRIFDSMEKILYRIEKNHAISLLHGQATQVSAKVAKRLKQAGQNLLRVAAFFWKHKFTVAVGVVFFLGAAPYLSPALQAAGQAFATKGADAGTSVLIRQLTHKLCMLASSPRIMGLVLSATMYAIVNSNWFVGVLGAALSGAAFASLIGATVATGGVGGAFGAALILFMKRHGITWEKLIRNLFQNQIATVGIAVVPQLIMQYVGFVLATFCKGLCTLNDVVTTSTGLLQTVGDYVIYAAQWIAEKTIGATAPMTLTATGAEQIAGASLTALGQILQSVENNTLAFADAMQQVLKLLDLTQPITAIGAVLAPLLTYVLSNKNEELEEVNRMRNYSYELQDFVVNESLMTQTAYDAVKKELAGQQSSLSELDQGRLSNNAVVTTLADQLEVMAKTVTPHNFVVTVKPAAVAAPQPPSTVNIQKDVPELDAPKESLKELQDVAESFREIDRVLAKTAEAKKVLEEGKKEFIAAANKADTPIEAKYYDEEVGRIVDMQNDLVATTFDRPSIRTTFLEPHPPTEAHPDDVRPLVAQVLSIPQEPITLVRKEKPKEAIATLKRPLPPPPPPPQDVLARADSTGIAPSTAPPTLPPLPPPFTTPVALSPEDMQRVQKQSGASAILLNTQGQIETIVDEKTGEFQQVDPPLPPPPGPPLLPTAKVFTSLSDAIKQNATKLKPVNRDALKASLDAASKLPPPAKTTQIDLGQVLSNAFAKKFASINTAARGKALLENESDWE